MKKKLFLLLLLVTSATFAQVKFEGTVKDSIGTPLELANVVAINQTTKIMDSYGITNADGKYKLALEKNTTYNIQISYIGYKTEQRIIEVKEDDLQRDYNLQTDNSLDEVEIVYEMPEP